jgi:hypothetical protein
MGHSNHIGNFWQVEIGAISKLVQLRETRSDAYTLCNECEDFRGSAVSKFNSARVSEALWFPVRSNFFGRENAKVRGSIRTLKP